MDIKRIMPTAEVEFTLDRKDEAGEPVTVKLTVSYVSVDEIGDFVESGKRFRFSKAAREMLIDAVCGWDLTEDGAPLECDEKNKRRVLPVLLGQRLAGTADNPLELVLGRKLLEFAADDGNFLKN